MFPSATRLPQRPAVVHGGSEPSRRLSGWGECGGGERDEQGKMV